MKKNSEAEANESAKPAKVLTCGIVMPISALDGCPADHWLDVQNIIKEAVNSIEDPKFTVRLVSDADEIGVIQKRIVQNLHDAAIVVCDVSGKNPNVMFELGLRLAFDKPTIIVKDDKTDYSFDTGVIEHIPYPRDLRFKRIVDFKARLAEKIVATHKAALSDPNHSPFLKSFGQFKVAKLNEIEIPAEKAILEALSDLQRELALLRNRQPAGARVMSLRQQRLLELEDRITMALIGWFQDRGSLPESATEEVVMHVEKALKHNVATENISTKDLQAAIDVVLGQIRGGHGKSNQLSPIFLT